MQGKRILAQHCRLVVFASLGHGFGIADHHLQRGKLRVIDPRDIWLSQKQARLGHDRFRGFDIPRLVLGNHLEKFGPVGAAVTVFGRSIRQGALVFRF